MFLFQRAIRRVVALLLILREATLCVKTFQNEKRQRTVSDPEKSERGAKGNDKHDLNVEPVVVQ